MKMNYSYNEMKRAFECGRNFQLTGENNFQELIEKQTQPLQQPLVMPSLPTMDEIKLEPVYGSTYCRYSVIEQKLAILYQNQEKLLQAIKLLGNGA